MCSLSGTMSSMVGDNDDASSEVVGGCWRRGEFMRICLEISDRKRTEHVILNAWNLKEIAGAGDA